MELVIERSKWLRGDMDSYLYRTEDSKMCCLGFLACAVGYTQDEISDSCNPASLPGDRFPGTIVNDKGKDTYLTNALINVNDNLDIQDADRERILKDMFKVAGIDVTFIP